MLGGGEEEVTEGDRTNRSVLSLDLPSHGTGDIIRPEIAFLLLHLIVYRVALKLKMTISKREMERLSQNSSLVHPLPSLDMLDQSLAPSDEPDDLSSYDMQLEMGSIYAQHGLGFYMGSCVVCENRAGLAQVMLASSSNSAAIGRLLTSSFSSEEILHGGLAPNKLSSSLAQISKQQQQESSLYNAGLPIVPRMLSLSVTGPSFHEYISSTSQISKLEFSRLSQNELWGSSRKSRQSRHYLTTGKLQLSPEEAELLARCNSYDGNICH
ncbi:hypothetical protein FCM35_KLT20627 [Carex littledalei]|uniref:Uncharacterized protein n=1 Tax=Carex littledalei TaxID=544730 RepID=A0A833VPN8_9POAL|nr:hypothetical protein FCM35_KLT20627 [Carex littledalei]